MEARAVLRYARISPRKVGIVLDLVRGKNVGEAVAILKNTPKAASPLILKLLKSACANAENNYEMDADSLYVSACYADQGPTLKRIRQLARGSASRILKKTSHITVAVKEKDAAESDKSEKPEAASKAKVK